MIALSSFNHENLDIWVFGELSVFGKIWESVQVRRVKDTARQAVKLSDESRRKQERKKR